MEKIRHPKEVIELNDTARSAFDAANSLKVPVGAIVKTLIFVINNQSEETPIVTLIAGDKKCKINMLPKILNIKGMQTALILLIIQVHYPYQSLIY